jgi:hypothetical protein
MTSKKLPTHAFEDPNLRRRVIEILNQLSSLLPAESGTWTAAIQGSGTAGTYQIGTQLCRYVRMGRYVNLSFSIGMAAVVTGGGTGELYITGAPFIKSADTNPVGAAVLSAVDFATAGASIATAFANSGTTSILRFIESSDAAAAAGVSISGLDANDTIYGAISYETDDP